MNELLLIIFLGRVHYRALDVFWLRVWPAFSTRVFVFEADLLRIERLERVSGNVPRLLFGWRFRVGFRELVSACSLHGVVF